MYTPTRKTQVYTMIYINLNNFLIICKHLCDKTKKYHNFAPIYTNDGIICFYLVGVYILSGNPEHVLIDKNLDI
jgi:hypothetical protein